MCFQHSIAIQCTRHMITISNNVSFIYFHFCFPFFRTDKRVSKDNSNGDGNGVSKGANQKHVLYIGFTVCAVSVICVGIAAFCLAKKVVIKR